MNIQHLRYAVEVERTGSITEAAENLYMGQPNLSRAIKELENSLGISIFDRTTRGIVPTAQGEEFLHYARSILSQFDAMTAHYQKKARPEFRISVPRASYIAQAFARFASGTPDELLLDYKETNALRAIRNVTEKRYPLGIVRYQAAYEPYFLQTFLEKQLAYEEIWTFRYCALMPARHPAASGSTLTLAALKNATEIVHGDTYVPSLPTRVVDEAAPAARRIQVYERGSQFDLLCSLPNAFMWVSPVPRALLKRYDLVQLPCEDFSAPQKDVLIYPAHYRKTEYDQQFLAHLRAVRDEVGREMK